jgi:predicted transcriptional regulator
LSIKYHERRTPFEIIASILDACQYATGKTKVMYQCNMSFKQLTEYLDLLLETNLLLIDNNRQYSLFRVSNKGKDFLKAYKSMKTLMELS